MPTFVPNQQTSGGARSRGVGTFVPAKGAAPKKGGGGGGFLHGVGRALGQTYKDLEQAAVSSPAGLVTLGRAASHDTAGVLGHLPGASPYAKKSRGASELAPIAKGLAIQTKHDFEHPLSHPGNTLLDVLSVASLGGGFAARAGAVGRVARAGEGAGAIARAATTAPRVSRVLRYTNAEGKTFSVQAGAYAKSPAVRQVQKALDSIRAKHPYARVGLRTQIERVGAQNRANVGVLDKVAQIPAARLRASTRKLTDIQHTALRVAAEGAPIDDRVATLQKALAVAKPRQARALKQEIALLGQARKYIVDMPNEHGVVVPRLTNTRLQGILGQIRDVAGAREEAAKGAGLLTESAAANRASAPGRLFKGAHFENPTPAKLGVPNRGLIRARSRVASLERRHENALRNQRSIPYPDVRVPGKSGLREVPRTKEEAAARVDDLQKWVDKRVKVIYDEYRADPATRTQSVGPDKRPRRIQTEADKFKTHAIGTGTPIEEPLKPLRQVNGRDADWQRAEADIHRLGSKEGAHPALKQIADKMDELQQLKDLLNENASAPIFGHEAPGYGTVKKTGREPATFLKSDMPAKIVKGGPNVTRIGGALSVARDELARLEQAHANRVRPTGIVGAEHFNTDTVPDLIRIPYSSRSAKGVGISKGMGQGGTMGIQTAPGTLRHAYTGAIQLAGGGRKNVGRLVAEDYIDLHRWLRSEQSRTYFREFGQASPDGLHDPVAVRTKPNVKMRPDLQAAIRKREEGITLSKSEETDLHAALKSQYEDVFPKDVPKEPQDGIVWVERRLLGGMDNPRPLVGITPGSGAAKALGGFDAINNTAKMAYVTLKAAYALPNAASNLGLHLIQAGWAAPRNLARAARMNAKLGPELTASIDTLVGEGLTSVLESDRGPLAKTTTGLANFWGKGVDVPFRRASFLHEASVRGYKTAAQLHDLIDNPALRDHLLEVTHEANRALIDYGNLSPTEKDIIRRVVFLYPWTKGATVYAGRFLAHHPAQAAATAAAGRVGAQNQQGLGPLPSYARGLIDVGGGKTLNPNSASILGTPADVFATINAIATGHAGAAFQGSQMLSPTLAALLESITGRDGLGRPIKGSRLAAPAKEMANSIPLLNTYKALHGHTSKSYPMSKRQALLAALLSRAFEPVNTNTATLNNSASFEQNPR